MRGVARAATAGACLRHRLAAALALCAAVVATPTVAAAAPSPPPGASLQVGSVPLQPCPHAPKQWCGSLPVPFDRTDPAAGTITIAFVWIPATGAGWHRTIVAEQGGPGFGSIGSEGSYLGLFRPLLGQHNLLLVDNRGTGRSGAINCSGLEHFSGVEPSPAFTDTVAQCGERLNHQRQRPDGSWVHGADLYNTANAARDLADVLGALRTGPIDLYGDSYGTWFGQTFASRYPQLLHSLTLDASYQVLDLSPWYTSTVVVARRAFDASCTRSLACPETARSPVWSEIGTLAGALRRAPFTGTTIGNDGLPVTLTVDVRALVNLVNDAGVDAGVYRELHAGIRAYLDQGDTVPLLRLTAQSLAFNNGASGSANQFSAGLYFAVACVDYPQLFDMRATPAERGRQLAERVATLPPDTFAPFTTREWLSMDAYQEAFDACLQWPAPVHHDPPIVIEPPLIPSSVPALVIGGDLDSLTPAFEGGRVVARQLGSSARFVLVPNETHVTALGDAYDCASDIVDRFVSDPDQLQRIDVSCRTRHPEVHVVGSYPAHFDGVDAAVPGRGNHTTVEGLRTVTVGAAAAADALYRAGYLSARAGTGLRGGSFDITTTGTRTTAHLHAVRWVDDATVDGSVTVDSATLQVVADVIVQHPGLAAPAQLRISWENSVVHAVAVATGDLNGVAVEATLPAP